jgi:hypothetical protein
MSRNVFFLFRPFDSQCLRVSKGAKYNFFSISQVFWKFFENFRFRFSSYSPFIQRHHLLNLSKNLFLSVGKDNYLFYFSQIYFTFDIFYSLSIKISKNVCCCGCKTNTFIP